MRRTKRTFLILLGVAILAYIILYNISSGSNSDTSNGPVKTEPLHPSREFNSKFFNTSSVAANNELVFYSQCYCQKDLVYLKKTDDNRFEISIRNERNELVHKYYLEPEWIESLKLTCNVYNSLRRGPGQKVISFSYAPANDLNINRLIDAASELYPDWILRIYHSRSQVNTSLVCEKQCFRSGKQNGSMYDNVDFCDVDKIPFGVVDLWNVGYLLEKSWRWLPLGDDFVDVFLSRDLRACFIDREIAAVNEWLDSDKAAHVMRDHPSQSVEIPAGLWGFYVDRNRTLANHLFNNLIDNFSPRRWSLTQQALKLFNQSPEISLLTKYFWPHIFNDSLIHDSYHCTKFSSIKLPNGLTYKHSAIRPFPTKRDSYCYVSESSVCCRNGSLIEPISMCPSECRLSNEWAYC